MSHEKNKELIRSREERERQASKTNQPRKTDKFVTLIKVPGQKQPQISIGAGFSSEGDEDELSGFLGRCGAFCLSASQALAAGKISLTGQPEATNPEPATAEPPTPADPNEAAIADAKAKRLAEIEAREAAEQPTESVTPAPATAPA